MKRFFWLLLLTLGCATVSTAQSASFNFTASAHSVSGWTNIAGDPSTAVRTGTASSGITITSVATANWAPDGNCADDAGGATGGTFFPAAVMVNHWFQYGTSTAAYNALVPQVIIGGLHKDSVYTVKMTGSFIYNVPNTFNLNPIRYTVSGAVVYGYIDINGDSNKVNGATFQNIAPDSTGKIRVYVNTFGGSNTASICGVQVISGHTTVTAPTVNLTSPLTGTQFFEENNITLTATASVTTGQVDRVEFYANGTKIGADSSAPYSMAWISPSPGSYTITAKAIDDIGNSNTSSANIVVESTNYFWSTTGNIATGADTNFIGTVDTNRLAFRTNNIERMTILKDGTIGIGTKTTYGYALAVNGTAIFTKAKVKTAGTWPDYVFKKDYRLPGLKELEQYISANHHLPGIEPASVVQKEGIDLGDQQTVLLKKVEELTLYLIQQNKLLSDRNARLEAQQKEIDELKALIKDKK